MAIDSNRPAHRLYVGKLALEVNKDDLREHFSTVGEIVDIRVKKIPKRNVSYAFLNFVNESSLQEAINKFHDSQFHGTQIDVQVAEAKKTAPKPNANKNNNNRNNNRNNNNNNNNNNDRSVRVRNKRKPIPKKADEKEREVSSTTLFVSNLPFVIDDEKLKEIFSGHHVKSAYTVARNGRSRGYGFVEFEDENTAKAALESKNKHSVEDREISVRYAYVTEPVAPKSNSTHTLYVSNLSYKLTDDALGEIFRDYGISEAYVARTKKGRSKGFGFVTLAGEGDLSAKQEQVIAEKNKHKVDDREIYVRAAYNVESHDNSHNNVEHSNNNNDANNTNEPEVKQIALYVSNIPFSVTSEELGGLFGQSKGYQNANVVVAKKNGRSRGYGFVIFDTEENRDAALQASKDLKAQDRILAISIARGKKSNNNGGIRRGGRRRFSGARRGARRN